MLKKINNPIDLKDCQQLLQEINYSFSIRHDLLWPYHEPLKISLRAVKKVRVHDNCLLFSVDDVLLFKLGIGDSYYVDPGYGLFFNISNNSLLAQIEYSILPIDDVPYIPLKDFSCHRVPIEYLNNPCCLKKFYISVDPRPGINHPLTYERALNNRNLYFEKKQVRNGQRLEIEFWAK